MGIWAAVKYALNSTVGTSAFQPLDKLLFTPHGTQTFKSDGTFTVPDGVTKIWITACAGGQGGTRYRGSGSYKYGGKGGDGGECIIREPYSVSAGQTISITVGNGGSAGSNGTPTIIGNLVTLRGGGTTTGLVGAGVGGEGGFYYDSSSNRGAEYGLDGVRGNGGTVADRSVRSSPNGGGGGGSYGCGGNGADSSKGASQFPPGYGGGGGGGSYNYDGASAGGDGIVIIEW